MASESFNLKKKDLTIKWLERNDYQLTDKREGIIGIKNDTAPILFKSFGRERTANNQDTLFTLKREDFNNHLKQAAKIGCKDLVYSLYLEKPRDSFQLIIQRSFLEKQFVNNATINFNTQNFSYFKSQGIEIITVT